jgi:hypothetical protein
MTVAGSGRPPGRNGRSPLEGSRWPRRSSRFSLRSRRSSSASAAVGRSLRSPRSASSWRIQVRIAPGWIPSSRATWAIGRRGCSERQSRSARSFSSGGYLRVLPSKTRSLVQVDQVRKPPGMMIGGSAPPLPLGRPHGFADRGDDQRGGARPAHAGIVSTAHPAPTYTTPRDVTCEASGAIRKLYSTVTGPRPLAARPAAVPPGLDAAGLPVPDRGERGVFV